MTADEATELGDPSGVYLVSKTLAEKAAFNFVEKEKPAFSIATVAPPMAYGPLLSTFDSMEKLNTSSADIYRLYNGSLNEPPATHFWAYVHVRDSEFAFQSEGPYQVLTMSVNSCQSTLSCLHDSSSCKSEIPHFCECF